MGTRSVGIVVVVALVAVGVTLFLTSSRESAAENSAVKIKWYGFDEGVALARQANKKILVDVYTDWCGWCKKLDKEVYSNGAVSQIMTSDFIAIKLNAESQNGVTFHGRHMDEASLAGAMGVTGYPTILFLDPSAKPITRIPGYMEPKEFACVLHFIGEDHYKKKTFEEYKSSTGN